MAGKSIPSRSDVSKSDTWDLEPLFASDKEWEALFTSIEKEIDTYTTYKGTLGKSAATLKEVIEFDLRISRDLEKIYTYAHLKSDEDKANQEYLGFYQRAMNLYTRISELASYITPEIQSIDDSTMAEFLKSPELAEYSFFMEKILRFKPHTRSQEIEEILAMSTEVSQASSYIFSQLDNVDLTFGSIENDKGQTVELSHGNFSTFLVNQNRELREKAFFQYYKEYEEHKNTIAASLAASIRKDYFYSKVRKFENCRRSALFGDNVEDAVYDNLVNVVRESAPIHMKYLAFRKEALGLDTLHFYDTYVPIIPDIDFTLSYEDAVDICVEALEPLGVEYCSIMKEGLLNGWVDRYENKGKRSGAYSSGCYDSPPYILMNYEENNINSLYTLIHEAGHSMHSYLSKKQQPYHYSDYTIFVAEVASTFNETLLSTHLLKKYANDNKMKAYISNREIDNIRATLFRQTMFAEFEKKTHEVIEANQPLTLETLTDIYNELLQTYFKESIHIDEQLKLECLRIPHFYSAFYVYKYATGISAAIALADMVLNGGEKERDRYLGFLGLGGSKFPLDELLEAGVDMRKPDPIKNAMAHFDSLVDELKKDFNEM